MTSIELVSSPEELERKFKGLKTPSDVADLLEIPYKDLIYLLYRKKPETNYETFSISKKDGTSRDICAPIGSLKILQKKLSRILELVYNPKPSVNGFLTGKSILTNAQAHINETFA